MDHGQEFCLVAFAQSVVAPYRLVGRAAPYRKTTSTKNNVVEIFWPETQESTIRSKRALNEIIADDITDTLDENDPVFKYCLSWITFFVSEDAVKHLLNSWNYHRIPGSNGCIPIQNMVETKSMATLPEFLIPSTPEIVRMYEADGGNLTRNADFGFDPLVHVPDLFESREIIFKANVPSSERIFQELVHGNYDSLEQALRLFYTLTIELPNMRPQE